MKRILHLGLRPPPDTPHERYTHYPVIAIEPSFNTVEWKSFCHFIFTSRTAVQLLPKEVCLPGKTVIAVGKATAAELAKLGVQAKIAQTETAEGVVELLSNMDLRDAKVLWPHSGQARSVISDYLSAQGVNYSEWVLYNVVFKHPGHLVNLDEFDEVLFTSPSTVQSFLEIFRKLPPLHKCRAIGPVTLSFLFCQFQAFLTE